MRPLSHGLVHIFMISVEDPSENFQRLRDFVDARNCMKLKSFQPEKLREGYDDDMPWEAREKLKINRVRQNLYMLICIMVSFQFLRCQ